MTSLEFIINLTIIGLLIPTILYAYRLNKNLNILRENQNSFAKLIDAKMNQRYPGVSRGIRMDDWRYNQHLHPRALLIEVGCQDNTKEEAQRGI